MYYIRVINPKYYPAHLVIALVLMVIFTVAMISGAIDNYHRMQSEAYQLLCKLPMQRCDYEWNIAIFTIGSILGSGMFVYVLTHFKEIVARNKEMWDKLKML